MAYTQVQRRGWGLTPTQGRRSLRSKPAARRQLQAVLGAKGLQGQPVLHGAERNRSRPREGVPKAPRRGVAGQSQAPTSGSPTAGWKTAGGRAASNSRSCSHPNLGPSVHTHKHTLSYSFPVTFPSASTNHMASEPKFRVGEV